MPNILILYGTVTGNAEYCADKAAKKAREAGFTPELVNMADTGPEILEENDTVLIVVSTYGEGEPPDGTEDLYDAVVKGEGNDFSKIRYSVLALGDTGYEEFCKCGRDYDEALEKGGATRFYPLVQADTDYDTPCEEWIDGVFAALQTGESVNA